MWSMKERRVKKYSRVLVWTQWWMVVSFTELENTKRGVALRGKIRNSILDTLDLRFSIRKMLGLKIKIGNYQHIAAFEAMGLGNITHRKPEGWNWAVGHANMQRSGRRWEPNKRERRARLGGGKQSMWDGTEAKEKKYFVRRRIHSVIVTETLR